MLEDYLTVGIACMVISFIGINFLISDEVKRNKLNTLYTYLFTFLLGIFIHHVTLVTGLNKFYCDKKCRAIMAQQAP